MCAQLAEVSRSCTQYFSRGATDTEERFISETCETYAFGSNSSSQLAMGSVEKFTKAATMQNMANCQVVGERERVGLEGRDGRVEGGGEGLSELGGEHGNVRVAHVSVNVHVRGTVLGWLMCICSYSVCFYTDVYRYNHLACAYYCVSPM